jgi:N-acetylmuramoyl-L-alanine amidase
LDNIDNDSVTSWHYVIAQDTIIRAIPDNENAWHAGDGSNGKGNRSSLGIELCESGDFEHTVRTAAKFIALKLKDKGLGVASVVPHKHWKGKNCPRLLLNRWFEFIGIIQNELDLLDKPVKVESVPYPWSVDALNWASSNKISDCSRLEEPATRREMIVLLYNTVNYILKTLKGGK